MTTLEVLEGPDGRKFIHVHTGDMTLLRVVEDEDLELLEQTLKSPHPLKKRRY